MSLFCWHTIFNFYHFAFGGMRIDLDMISQGMRLDLDMFSQGMRIDLDMIHKATSKALKIKFVYYIIFRSYNLYN